MISLFPKSLHAASPGLLFLAFSLPVGLSVEAESMTALDIMNRVADRDLGDDVISKIEFTITSRKRAERNRSVISYSKVKGEDDRMTMMIVKAPKSLLNTGFLSIDYKKDDPTDTQWIYLSSLKKTKRIASKDKSGRFISTDFSYYDLTVLNTDKFDYEILEETTLQDAPVWKIQATARSATIAKETGYQQSLFWVRRDPYLVLKADHQTDNAKRRKEYVVNAYEQQDGIWIITDSVMKTYYKDELEGETSSIVTETKFNQDLKESLFTVRKLERGL